MKKIFIVIAMFLATVAANAQPGYVPSEANLQARKEFSEARFGIFIHWGIYSMIGNGEWIMEVNGIPYNEYRHLAEGFYPSGFDADQWVKAFKGAGARYVTFTSRHHDGFSMFKTSSSEYNIVDCSPFGRDIVGELAAACRREGIKLNLYYSQLDWGRDDYYPLGNSGRKSGRPEGGDWKHYQDFMYAQLTELLTNYGDLGAIWFDGMWDKQPEDRTEWKTIWDIDRQYELIHRLQPSCLVASNHHRAPFEGEDMQIFERDVPGETLNGYTDGQEVSRLPLETCQTIGFNWGYDISKNDKYKSASELIQLIARTAGKGANLLLNIGPRPDGTIPEIVLDRLNEIGKWMDKYGETIYATQGGCIPAQSWGVTTQKGKVLYVHVLKHEDSILLPVKDNKLLEARTFDGTPVQAGQYKEGIILSVPQGDMDEPDQIIVLRFRDTL